MFTLIKNNVERVVKTEAEKAKLEAKGFKLLQVPEKSIDEMHVAELRKLAEEEGIEGFDKMKKDELIKALKELEENDGKDT